MTPTSILIPKLNDRQIIRAFQKVAELHGLQASFSSQFGALDSEQVSIFAKAAGQTLVRAVLAGAPTTWTWLRLEPAGNNAHPDAADYDRLAFSVAHGHSIKDEQIPALLSIDAALKKELRGATTRAENDSALDLATGRQVLQALQSTTQELLLDAAEHRSKLEKEFAEREAAREERFAAERESERQRLEREREQLREDALRRETDLDARADELDARRQELDDRDNTHVRREIRASLLKLTEDRLANFVVSSETRRQYLTVHILALAGVSALALTAFFSALAIPNVEGTAEFATASIRASLAGAAAVALGVWYLRWQNRWLQRIADAEFKLQQFRLDIERASWLAETVLEWKQSSPEPFPELLASRLSTGLFQSAPGDDEDPRTPASQLAEALLGAASTAKLRLGEQELAFDRKGIRRLDQDG